MQTLFRYMPKCGHTAPYVFHGLHGICGKLIVLFVLSYEVSRRLL